MTQASPIKLTYPQRISAAQGRIQALKEFRANHPGLARGGYASQIGGFANFFVHSPENFNRLNKFTDDLFSVAEDFCVQETLDHLRGQTLEVDDCHKAYDISKTEEEKVPLYDKAIIAADGMRDTLLFAIKQYSPPPRKEVLKELFGIRITTRGVLDALRELSTDKKSEEVRVALIEDIEKYLKSELPPLLDCSIHRLLSMVGKRGYENEVALVSQYSISWPRRRLREEVTDKIQKEINKAILAFHPAVAPAVVWENGALTCRSISAEQVKKIEILNSVLAEGEAAEGDISFFNLPNIQTIAELKETIDQFLDKGYIHLFFAMEKERFSAALAGIPEILRQRREIEAALLGGE